MFSKAATGVASVDAVTVNPGGAVSTRSPWHPTGLFGGLFGEENAARHASLGRAVFAQTRVRHPTPELLGHDLESVADSQDWDSELDDSRVERRRTGFVDARRTARQDDGERLLVSNFCGRDGVRHDLAVHVRFSNASRNQLRILSAKINDENGSVSRHRVASSTMRRTRPSVMNERKGTTPPRASMGK